MGTLNCTDMTSGTKLQHQQAPTSPTASFSESNVVASSTDPDAIDALAGLQALRFDGDIDGEIQSPDLAMWESLFADQIGAGSGADFLMSSPRRDFSPLRDFMVSSPKRDYMVSSPKRDYMMSSPKRDYMVSSPKREMVSSPRRTTFSNLYNSTIHGNHQGYVHGVEAAGSPQTQHNSLANKGKSSMSPLHKVYINNNHNNSSKQSNGASSLSCSSSYVVHGENLSLPSMDPFLEEYKEGYLAYQLPEKASAGQSATALTSSSQLPTLSECLAMPEPGYGGGDGDGAATAAAMAGGIPVGAVLHQPDHLYYASQFGAAEGLPLQHQMAKPDQWTDSSSLHSMLGSVIQSEVEQVSNTPCCMHQTKY
jgi:hypothetical protein